VSDEPAGGTAAAAAATPASDATASAAPRLALRSPVEIFVWIFLTRLLAVVMPTRAATRDHGAGTGSGTHPPSGAPVDPRRVGRVAASRSATDATRSPVSPPSGAPTATGPPASSPDAPITSRTIVLTAATAVAAGAAAFAAGRRRGAR